MNEQRRQGTLIISMHMQIWPSEGKQNHFIFVTRINFDTCRPFRATNLYGHMTFFDRLHALHCTRACMHVTFVRCNAPGTRKSAGKTCRDRGHSTPNTNLEVKIQTR